MVVGVSVGLVAGKEHHLRVRKRDKGGEIKEGQKLYQVHYYSYLKLQYRRRKRQDTQVHNRMIYD